MVERRVILLLCYVNFLLFLNRGIIPGAPESFQSFISKSLDVPASRQNFYLGLLSSVYVASTAVFSLVFGSLALRWRPFQLIAWGMLAWVVAAGVSGLAYSTNSYALLVLGRFLSGAGEASFQCNAMPFINRHAPESSSTLWLGIFIASVTMGMASGYIYGSAFAASSLTWAAAFFVEGVLMLPAIAMVTRWIPGNLNEIPGQANDFPTLDARASRSDKAFASQWWQVFANTPFTLIALGYGAYTFTLGCFSTFSPTLLIGLGFFDSEVDVSLVFGCVVLVCGTVGTIAGGLTLDRLTADKSVSRCKVAVDMLFYLMTATTVCGMIMMCFTQSRTWFFTWLAITYTLMAALAPAEMVAVMELFPESRQAMTVAANSVIILVFGDVPSPVVLGWLKDTWAPRCGTIEVDGNSRLNPDCHLDRSGLRDVLLFSVLWLLWAVLLWGAAKSLLERKPSKRAVANGSPAILSSDKLFSYSSIDPEASTVTIDTSCSSSVDSDA